MIPKSRNNQFPALSAYLWRSATALFTIFTIIFLTASSSSSLPDAFTAVTSVSSTTPISETRCMECHEDHVVQFHEAPHYRTLLRGNDPLAAKLLVGKEFQSEVSDRWYRYVAEDGTIRLKSNDHPRTFPVDWLFGSGHHARTPVTLSRSPEGRDELLQHLVSWYPDQSIGWTIGIEKKHRSAIGLNAIVTPHTEDDIRSCFGCHTTWLPETGNRIDFDKLVPGIHCTRCHQNPEEHIRQVERGDEGELRIERWSDLTPLESVNRCGECHRRADHFTPDELVTTNKLLIRFASASLVMSTCFKKQRPERRLDCMTCHNPHRPAETNPAFYNKKCQSCHQADLKESIICNSPQTTDKCTSCHMPKETLHEGLRFTDHWIRSH